MPKLAKSEFYNLGLYGNTNTIFSPKDVDKLEVPDIREYRKTVESCRFFYRKDPITSTVLNKLVDIGITSLVFDKGSLSENEYRIFTGIKGKLQKFAEECALEFLISGLVVPEIKYEPVSKLELKEMGVKKYEAITVPSETWIRDPATIKINSSLVMNDPSYYVEIPDDVVFFITTEGRYKDGTTDKDTYDKLVQLYPKLVAAVKAGKREILIENKLIIRRRPLSDSPYPSPYLYPALEILKHKRNLRRMDYSVASRVITAIQQFKLGNDEFPVTEDDADQFTFLKDQMSHRGSNDWDTERIYQLFTNHTVEIKWIFPEVDTLLNEAKYTDVNADIFFALGFPRILTTGETERSSSSDPEFASMSPVKTMENMRNQILTIIKGIVREVVILNGFKSYPTVTFSNINLHSFKNFVEGMSILYDTGNLSRTSLADSFGFRWEEEMKLKSEEKDTMEELGIEEFAPKPFSPQPNTPGVTPAKPTGVPGKENKPVDKPKPTGK